MEKTGATSQKAAIRGRNMVVVVEVMEVVVAKWVQKRWIWCLYRGKEGDKEMSIYEEGKELGGSGKVKEV